MFLVVRAQEPNVGCVWNADDLIINLARLSQQSIRAEIFNNNHLANIYADWNTGPDHLRNYVLLCFPYNVNG